MWYSESKCNKSGILSELTDIEHFEIFGSDALNTVQGVIDW